jgi:uncharacterized membrane protein
MNWYAALKFLHISAVIMSVGGMFARQLLRQHARNMNDVQSFAAFSQAAGNIEKAMVIPGMEAIMVLGIVLALVGGAPMIGFLQGASQNWLLASNLLLLGILVIIPTVLIPRGKKFEPVLKAALEKGQIMPELRDAMNDNAVRLAHLYEEIAVIIIVALMVLKPF